MVKPNLVMTGNHYLLALGSNRRHVHFGAPRAILCHAIQSLQTAGCRVIAASDIITSRPVGPSQRCYANGAVIVETPRDPIAMLTCAKAIERKFGRRRGRRWGPRVLDIDVILWSGGVFAADDPALVIPHPLFRTRPFVTSPAAQIAAGWRDPVQGLTMRQLDRRRCRPKPLDRAKPPL
ncbi:MAG: 2-amino-4-hydroxy-6-hydroxymethyldihydropteridine diphosphokinase [Parasphingorhabdus sp.]|nr:2-amino-4-hydroxy-6-hydroxymethyldihydropteridine diphosphokinase [Parasphingorhabdus sp.]